MENAYKLRMGLLVLIGVDCSATLYTLNCLDLSPQRHVQIL